jgi:GTP pyrophosphokinase
VNGRIVPLRHQLQSGDVVEIVTTPSQVPSTEWLKFVKTSRARARIRSWVKTQQNARSVAVGRSILVRDVERHQLDFGALKDAGRLAEVARELGLESEDALLTQIGYGKVPSLRVLERLVPAEQLAKGQDRGEGRFQRLMRLIGRHPKGGVRVSGVDDPSIRFGRCCQPLPGERIMGFMTRGRGVTVHTYDCPKVLDSDPARHVEVEWESDVTIARPVLLDVTCVDRPGLLAAMTAAISQVGVNIRSARSESLADEQAQNHFEVMVRNLGDLKNVMRNLGRVRGVIKVTRVRA